MNLKDFIPPIVYQLKLGLFGMQKRVNNLNFPVYSSYREAEAACGDSGYEQEELVETVFHKTLTLREQLLKKNDLILTESVTQSLMGLLFVLNSQNKKEINVLDYGGACGAHYFTVRATLPNTIKLKWHVVETPTMVGKAKLLEDDELRFFNDLTTARKAFNAPIDYFHSSGTIQYTPNPEITLNETLACQAQFIMLNRLALSSGKQEIVTIQESRVSENGSGPLPVGFKDKLCKYPIIYYPKHRLEDLIRANHSIILRFGESVAPIFGNRMIIHTGYFIERSY